MKRENYNLFDANRIASRLRTGRHQCNCQARIHILIRNCLNCGRIVCEQEGSGPCFYCGNLVCTRDEREILNKKDAEALQLLRKLFNRPNLTNFDSLDNSSSMAIFSLSSISEKIKNANAYKMKLIRADKDQEITKVNDLQADYFTLELNPYLTQSERDAIVKRKEQLRHLSLQEKRNILVDVDIEHSSATLREKQQKEPIESINDPILQSILTNSLARNFYKTEQADTSTDENDIINEYKPRYQEELSRSLIKPEEVFDSIVGQNENFIIKKCENLFCIGLLQPLATDLLKATISSIPWFEYVHYQGLVLISAISDKITVSKCGSSLYRVIGSNEGNGYPQQMILGRAYLRECLSLEEFMCEEHSDLEKFDISKSNNKTTFMLIFEDQELLAAPIPYSSPNEFFQLNKQMIQTINATLGSGAGIFDSLSTLLLDV